MEIKVRVKDTATKKFENAARKVAPALMRGVNDGLYIIETRAKLNVTTGGGSGLHVRSGHFRREITHEPARKVGKKIKGRVGAPAIPGTTHEFGATIRPKRARALTIPLGAAKARSGAGRGKARDFPNTFIAKGMIFQRVGRRIVPLFVLKKMVTIPKRPWLRPTVHKSLPKVINAIARRLREAFK